MPEVSVTVWRHEKNIILSGDSFPLHLARTLGMANEMPWIKKLYMEWYDTAGFKCSDQIRTEYGQETCPHHGQQWHAVKEAAWLMAKEPNNTFPAAELGFLVLGYQLWLGFVGVFWSFSHGMQNVCFVFFSSTFGKSKLNGSREREMDLYKTFCKLSSGCFQRTLKTRHHVYQQL